MPFHSMTRRRALLGAAAALALPRASWAQGAYPSRPVQLIHGFGAGGNADVVARLVGQKLQDVLGQPVVIDIKSGAGGAIATGSVVKAVPDGYSLVMLTGAHTVSAALRKNLGYGTAGVGTPHHIAMEQLLNTSQLQAEHIPYKGDAPALQDLAGGQIKVAALAPSLSLPFVSDGKLVPLAVTGDKRLPQLPQVPTLLELNLARQPIYAWQGLVAPAGTPPERIGKLSQELQQSLKNPEVVRKLEDLGMEPIASTPEAMTAYVRKEQALWGPFIKARGITNK